MLLRNRDLNVQKNVEPANKQHREHHKDVANAAQKPGAGKPAAVVKRQAAHLVKGGTRGSGGCSSGSSDKEAKDEPRPKRACSQTDKENNNNNVVVVGHHRHRNENAAAVVPVTAFSRSLLIDSAKKDSSADSGKAAMHQQQNKRVSAAGGAPVAGRRRTSALLVARDTNAVKSQAQQSSQKEEKQADEQKMEADQNDATAEQQQALLNYDFDKETAQDMAAVADYAQDIFLYYKYRERFFRVADYLGQAKHPEVTVVSRAKLVDWMVELQETFELNHETLYLGVKLVDMFMNRTKQTVPRAKLQLIGSTALFISSKFDERAPPLIDDFIYLAEDSFAREELLEKEREMLKVIEFDLGSPLSYRFLRRYARVRKLDMGTLTLARFVLETSLMFLDFCRLSESLIAAACLLLALRMKGLGDWDPVLDKYTGYTRAEVEPLMWRLNRMVAERKQHHPKLDTVFRKYSHEIFFEVAKTKLLREPAQ